MIPEPAAYWLLRIAVALAVPAIPCFAYYSLAHIDDAHGLLYWSVVLAGPLALIGGVAWLRELIRPQRSRTAFWIAGSMVVLPAVWLLWMRA